MVCRLQSKAIDDNFVSSFFFPSQGEAIVFTSLNSTQTQFKGSCSLSGKGKMVLKNPKKQKTHTCTKLESMTA